ncbi:2-oxo-tetronate isomerase [Hyphomicrobium sp. CS1GBMeth3]|uniref:2-oxo-tetronate isomerase n=1 Tax=Hyphomicrobium sp. CS1GBMeth3 TaxID=1892845 RepID=UPI0009307573|nr:2-oxo-tetronate isomerase [Hyphomicrobium sp. CS1GBMeth3]
MPRFDANLSFLFTDLPFLDRFEAAARAGFKGVEFMFPYAVPADEIRARLDATGLELVLFNLPPGHWDKGERGFAALPGREDEFASAVDLALTYAEALGCRRLHVMAGLATHGATRETYIANLRLAADWAAPSGIDILIEPINTRDIPGYFLTRTAEARDVIAEVGAPNLGLQFDLYHRHLMEGDIENALAEFGPLARHYQCADPPDRGEPSMSVLDYARIFRLIDASGYTGWIGCEYKPRGATLDGLAWTAACGVTLG